MLIAVHSAQILLIALASYLLFMVAKLSREELQGEVVTGIGGRASARPLPRIESIARVQMFSGAQMLELRMNGVDSQHLRKRDWLVTGVGHYFLGACRAIGESFGCTELDVADMLHFVLRRNLGMDIEDATRMIDTLLLAPEETYHRDSASSGRAAAEAWLLNKHIPAELSLYSNISEWGVTL